MPRIASPYSSAERLGGAPVELYTLQRGSKVWRYTSADAAQTASGITFAPAVMKRSAIEQKQDAPGIQYTLTVSLNTPFGQDLLDASGAPVTCTLIRAQSGNTIAPVLAGEVTAVKFTDDDAELTVATIERRFKQLIPRVPVQRTCPWTIYSNSCGVDKTAFATSTTVSSVSQVAGGFTVTLAASQTDGYWTNGLVVMDAGGPAMFVAAHAGAVVTIWATAIPSTVTNGAGLTVYAGCDKLRSTCINKFNNLDNFAGFPDLPSKDPKLTQLDKTFAPGAIP